MKALTILCGPPCSGKSTLALGMDAPRFSVRHWFEPMRGRISLPPVGTLLDDERVFAAVRTFLRAHETAAHIVFDGFPGNTAQLEWVMSELPQAYDISFLYLSTDRETALRRALARRVCFHCDGGADPVIPTGAGCCPVCGNALSNRTDDTEQRFRERWEGHFVRARDMYRRDSHGLYRAAVDEAHKTLLQNGLRMDLHLHTTASDGSDDPAEIMDKAASAGIGLCAVTDHDTVAGLEEAYERTLSRGLAFLPGIEVSALWQGQLIHLLGYGIDPKSAPLRSAVEYNLAARQEYDSRVLHKLEKRTMLPPGTEDRYRKYEWDRREGGWKLLSFLKNVGICRDGFDYLRLMEELDAGLISFLAADNAIAAIQDTGLCVLAHPGAYGWARQTLHAHLDGLRKAGINGVECFHPQNTPALTEYLLRYCSHWKLLSTGGSDEHGNLPDRTLGMPRVDTRMLDAQIVLEKIKWPDIQKTQLED